MLLSKLKMSEYIYLLMQAVLTTPTKLLYFDLNSCNKEIEGGGKNRCVIPILIQLLQGY